MRKLFTMLVLAASLFAAKPANFIWVANVSTSEKFEFSGQTWYYFFAPLPENPGKYLFQVSHDAGFIWTTLNTLDFTDPDRSHWPYTIMWVNPRIGPPYVWYRFVQLPETNLSR